MAALLAIFTAVLLVFSQTPVTAQAAKHYTELSFPPVPEIQLPSYRREQLDNGIVVYLLEDHELPLVQGTALFRTGSRFEPADRVGLAELTGQVLRTGGTQSHPVADLNRQLEDRAAFIEASIGRTQGSVGFNALTEDMDAIFGLFTEIIQEPAFAEEQVELAKIQQRGEIARRNDDPDEISRREFGKLIYGASSPYARTVEYKTLEPISRADLVRFYQQSFQPQGMILGIVGDFDSDSMLALVREKFGSWRPSTPPLPDTLSPVQQTQTNGVFLVNQPQLTQSYVGIGQLGGDRRDPDFPVLGVINEVMNGFGGRLFNQVRSRQGLAYSVYGYWAANYDYPGIFIAGGQTRTEATVPFIQTVKKELERLRREPITEAELKAAQDSVLNSFVFNFQDNGQILSRLLTYEYYGYPADFIFKFRQGVEKTTVQDVQRVAKTHLQPNQWVTLVVGPENSLRPTLKTLGSKGSVTSIDVTIPSPPAS